MSKAQVLDKGIRQKSTKRVNSFIACSAFCLGHPTMTPRNSEKRWRVYTSTAMMARYAWHVYKSSSKNTQKSECVYRRSPIGGTTTFAIAPTGYDVHRADTPAESKGLYNVLHTNKPKSAQWNAKQRTQTSAKRFHFLPCSLLGCVVDQSEHSSKGGSSIQHTPLVSNQTSPQK